MEAYKLARMHLALTSRQQHNYQTKPHVHHAGFRLMNTAGFGLLLSLAALPIKRSHRRHDA